MGAMNMHVSGACLGKVKSATNMARKARKSISKKSSPLLFCADSTVSPRPCCHQNSPACQPCNLSHSPKQCTLPQ